MEDAARLLQLVVNGSAAGCIYGLIALGFVLIYKATEMVNFAQGDIMMLGGFTAYSLIATLGLNYWVGSPRRTRSPGSASRALSRISSCSPTPRWCRTC